MFNMLGKNFSRQHFEIFFIENRLWHFMQTVSVCMKCQNTFSWKNKKNTISLSSSELAQRLMKVKPIRGDSNSMQCHLVLWYWSLISY